MNKKKNGITHKRVLIIDDEDVICKACEMVLNEQEFICDHCLSGEEGIQRVMEQDYDLLLLDMKLKEMDGMDILKRVKKEKPGLYVIVITGYSTISNTVKAMKLGANDYLSKPFADHELIDAVNALLDSEQ